VGTIYGMLVQYSDDIADAASQPNATLTLPRVYEESQEYHRDDISFPSVGAFWYFVYRNYLARVKQVLTVLPAAAQSTIIKLFTSTFEQH
jgi:hypothetical protein